MKFAKWVFLIAGIYGVLAVAPLYFIVFVFSAARGIHQHGICRRRSDLGHILLCWHFCERRRLIKEK
jgi:hypothetical protein